MEFEVKNKCCSDGNVLLILLLSNILLNSVGVSSITVTTMNHHEPYEYATVYIVYYVGGS